MSLEGHRLGAFELCEVLGKGASGTVYRARDTRLGREVAIKVLPRELAHDTELLGRFEREARLLATLNHPHVATIHGVEHDAGHGYLVLEFVDGEPLDRRLERGPMAVRQSIELGSQIASGLEAAHECGVIHRDLKPANVCLTKDGRAKVLDFGLAKPLEAENAAHAVTTSVGVVLGTPKYMSPEQAQGRTLDRRTDVWSFGCVMFEMLAGKPPFADATMTELIAAILEQKPRWELLPSSTPPRLRELLERCLEKDPRQRLRDIGDARIPLELCLRGDGGTERKLPGPSSRKRWPWIVAAASLSAVATLAVSTWVARDAQPRSPSQPASAERSRTFSLSLPPLDPLLVLASLAISPDGSHVAYGFSGPDASPSFLHDLAQLTAQPFVDMSYGPQNLAFTPDSAWVSFQSEQNLMRAAVAGSAPEVLAPRAGFFRYTWADTDTLVGVETFGGPVLRWAREQPWSEASVLAAPRHAEGDLVLEDAQQLSASGQLLYTVWDGTGWERAKIYLETLATGERSLLVADAYNGRVRASPGGTPYLFFVRQRGLYAAPLDLERGKLSAAPATLVEDLSFHVPEGLAHYDLSEEGTLIVAQGGTRRARSRLVRAEIDGTRHDLGLPPGHFDSLHVSSDGSRATVDIEGDPFHIALIELDATPPEQRRLTFERDAYRAHLTPDGRKVAYVGVHEGRYRFLLQTIDTEEASTTLLDAIEVLVLAFLPDGETVLLRAKDEDGLFQQWSMSLANPEGRAKLPFSHPEVGSVDVSPDSRWFAYSKMDGDDWRVFVEPYPGGGRRREVAGTGWAPRFASDGRWLYMRNLNSVWRAPFNAETGTCGPPVEVYDGPVDSSEYAVLPDGSMLLLEDAPDPDTSPLELVLIENVFALLE